MPPHRCAGAPPERLRPAQSACFQPTSPRRHVPNKPSARAPRVAFQTPPPLQRPPPHPPPQRARASSGRSVQQTNHYRRSAVPVVHAHCRLQRVLHHQSFNGPQHPMDGRDRRGNRICNPGANRARSERADPVVRRVPTQAPHYPNRHSTLLHTHTTHRRARKTPAAPAPPPAQAPCSAAQDTHALPHRQNSRNALTKYNQPGKQPH